MAKAVGEVMHHRITIEYQSKDGERRRIRYFLHEGDPRWWRATEAYEDGEWTRESTDAVGAPTVAVEPVGSTTFAGP